MRERASWPARDWEVRAILDGRKTQVRRAVKPQPDAELGGEPYWFIGGYRVWPYREASDPLRRARSLLACPYGAPGDRLLVREAFALEHSVEHDQPLPHADGRPVKRRHDDDIDCVHPAWIQPHYRATDPAPELCYEDGPAGGSEGDFGCRWRPSIHMPRWASRITLEIESVRVERLQDISEADAVAEGCGQDGSVDGVYVANNPRGAFFHLWRQINGLDSWRANPWVWVVEFRRLDTSAGCVESNPESGHE